MTCVPAIILHLYWNAAMLTKHLRDNFQEQLLSASPTMFTEQKKNLPVTYVFIVSLWVMIPLVSSLVPSVLWHTFGWLLAWRQWDCWLWSDMRYWLINHRAASAWLLHVPHSSFTWYLLSLNRSPGCAVTHFRETLAGCSPCWVPSLSFPHIPSQSFFSSHSSVSVCIHACFFQFVGIIGPR